MKKSELKQIIKEEIEKLLSENERFSSQTWIKKLTPQIQAAVEQLKKKYPKHDIVIVSNDRHWNQKLHGTHTLLVSGPTDNSLKVELKNLIKNKIFVL